MRAGCLSIALMVLMMGSSNAAARSLLDGNAVATEIHHRYGCECGGKKGFMIEEEFHLLGWSRKNLVAYILHEPNEARDFEIAKLIVQNLVSDKKTVVMKWNFEGSFKRSIEINHEEIYRNLQKFGIVSSNDRSNLEHVDRLRSFPIGLSQNIQIDVKKRARYATSKLFGDAETFLGEFRLEMIKESNGTPVAKKRIYSHRYKEDLAVYDLRVLGYLSSPYSDRILVMLARVYRGWEGAPNVLDFVPVGASLSKGFR